MNILVIQPWISYRGSEKISVKLVEELNRQGHQAKLACVFVEQDYLPLGGNRVSYLTAPGWVIWWCHLNRVTWFLFGFPALLWVVWRGSRGVDRLNPHNVPSHWAAFIVGWLRKIPVVWTCHNLPQRPYFGKLGNRLWDILTNLLDHWVLPKLQLIITFSNKTASQLKRLGAGKVLVHPSGVDYDFYCGQDLDLAHSLREEHDLLGKYVLLQVSTLHQAKNQELVFMALSKLKSKYPHLRLVLVGGGSYQSELERLAGSLGIDRLITWVGAVSAEKVRGYYQLADLHLSPGVATEGCTLAPLEALCQGKISVVAQGSGVEEYLEDKALITSPNADDFAKQIEWALSHRDLVVQLGERGRDWVRSNLSWKEYTVWFIDQITGLKAGKTPIVLKRSIWLPFFYHLLLGIKVLNQVEGSVLDIGCGGGMLTRAFKKQRPDLVIYGCDINRSLLKKARYLSCDIQYVYADVYHIPFDSDSFSAVLLFDILEHMDDPARALEEVRRVLKPGGVLYLSAPLEKSMFTITGWLYRWFQMNLKEETGHWQMFTKQELFRLLQTGGFAVTQSRYLYHYFYQFAYLAYLLATKLVGRASRNIFRQVVFMRERQYVPRNIFFKLFVMLVNLESFLFRWWPGQTILVAASKTESGNHPDES